MGNLDQPLTRSDVLITSADGSRVFLGKRKALSQLRGYVEREVFPWIQICGNLEFPAGLGKLC